jgi:hypothetical protein
MVDIVATIPTSGLLFIADNDSGNICEDADEAAVLAFAGLARITADGHPRDRDNGCSPCHKDT